MSLSINDVNNFVEELNRRLINIFKYVFKYLIFVVIGIMVILPIILKNTSFNNNDITVFKKNINVLSIEGKTNVKIANSYIDTGVKYSDYSDYIQKYNKSSLLKKSVVLELNLLFILLQVICLYFIMVNIYKLFIDKLINEYDIYFTKKSFAMNSISFIVFSFIRRFIFRNTIFASLSLSIFVLYLFSLFALLVVHKIVEMDKIDIKKAIQNEKYKKNK